MKRGMTLIELALVIVILGVSIPVLLRMWADVGWRSSRAEMIADATFYAEQLMEEIKSKRFDESEDFPWTSSASFGPEGLESSSDKDTFDDIDDFVGCTDAKVATPAAKFTRSAAVEYYRLNGSTWEACGGGIVCGTVTDCTTCSECCYKRIVVTVSRTGNLIKDVKLATLVSGY